MSFRDVSAIYIFALLFVVFSLWESAAFPTMSSVRPRRYSSASRLS
jgi:hypothetical protein